MRILMNPPEHRGVRPGIAVQSHFVYDETMTADTHADIEAAGVAAIIGEPARARMLYCLLDGRARTGTELAVIGEVSASTASVHLAKMVRRRLVTVLHQGKHRYYSLSGPSVARALEALSVVAGKRAAFAPSTPTPLRSARTCYDHLAGHWAVQLRDRFEELEWLVPVGRAGAYELSRPGSEAMAAIGVDIEATRALRRRFAYACIDWSERRPHIGGALGHALLEIALKQKWFVRNLDSRALTLTAAGRRQLQSRFGLRTSAGTVPA
jgi:DNA-binding transcriptional ArsR family regulator